MTLRWAAGLLACATTLCSAQTTNLLYNAPTTAGRDNYTGAVGCLFEVGSANVVVSHLGYFSLNASTGLAVSHLVGLYTANRSTPTIISQVTVPAGTSAYYTSNYYWMPLNPPLLLSPNTQYIVVGMAGNNDGDGWHDDFTATWNSVFVGTQATATRQAIYGPGNTTWPPASFGENGANDTYGAPNLANIPVGPAYVGVQQTTVAISAGQTLTVNGFASGQLPITYQWYSVSNTTTNLLSGQINPALVIPNAATTNSGTYFVFATNALGGEASANVVVTVSAIPVSITQQPTNTTVFENYTATFTITAAGTPPISYQWSSNGVVVPGATTNTFSLVAGLANNGDSYSCLVSNNVSSTPETSNSQNAVLTVTYNLGQPQEFLHGYKANIDTNSFTGTVGGVFEIGISPVLVTHLGYYASQYDSTGTNATLTSSHHVGIFSPDGTVLYGSVVVPSGLNPVINGYMWAALNPPLTLSTNTSYLLAAEVFSGQDPWGDAYTPSDWNSYYIGTNPPSSMFVRYSGAAWPTAPLFTFSSGGEIYSAPNMAILTLSPPSVYVQPAAVTNYAGFSATLTATVDGQAPLSVQWYEEPGTLLTGQTNLVLNFSSLVASNSGSYYVIVTNTVTANGAQSPDAVVTVLPDTGPSITQDVQPQTVFEYQTVQFSAVVSGTPQLLYQWTFNGNPIAGATTSTLTLNDVSAASAGNYQLLVTNNYGHTNSSAAQLTVTVPTWGSYPSAVMGTDLLLYYPFSDVNSGFGIATNQGSLGLGYDAAYEGIYSGVPGPFANTDPNNMAVNLDGLTADVNVPVLTNVVLANCTIAAWVNDVNNPQSPSGGNEAIFFQRNSSVLGLSVNPLIAGAGDQLRVTWANAVHDSGLVLPTNQWAFVAAVISPTNIAVWLQNGAGMQTTNIPGAFPTATFTGNSYVGWDTAGGSAGRRWTGPIDEVMLFNQALSATAINALYLGVPASATLTIARSGANVVITWPGGTLQQASNVAGPWSATVGAANGVYTVTTVGTVYYRVQLQ